MVGKYISDAWSRAWTDRQTGFISFPIRIWPFKICHFLSGQKNGTFLSTLTLLRQNCHVFKKTKTNAEKGKAKRTSGSRRKATICQWTVVSSQPLTKKESRGVCGSPELEGSHSQTINYRTGNRTLVPDWKTTWTATLKDRQSVSLSSLSENVVKATVSTTSQHVPAVQLLKNNSAERLAGGNRLAGSHCGGCPLGGSGTTFCA